MQKNQLFQKNQLHIVNGLPSSHQWMEVDLADQKIPGAVWDKNHIHAENGIFLYTNWPEVMFANPWYNIESKHITNEQATQRDIAILQRLLSKSFTPPATVFDVHCGAGRHALALAKKGFAVVGFEEIALPLRLAKQKAKEQNSTVRFLKATRKNYQKYQGTGDIVISMFNSMGYTFDTADDIRQITQNIGLLKPGGYFVLDIRSEKYQKEKFSSIPVTFINNIYSNESNNIRVSMVTKKYWKDSILGAKEKIIVEKEGKEILAQYMTYGWRTYSLKQLQDMLDTSGAELLDVQEDYYSSPENIGERIFLLAQAK